MLVEIGHFALVLALLVALVQGTAEPLALEVPALSTRTVVAEDQIRIPTSGDYSARFVCRGGTGVVIDREVTTSTSGAPPGSSRLADRAC